MLLPRVRDNVKNTSVLHFVENTIKQVVNVDQISCQIVHCVVAEIPILIEQCTGSAMVD